MLAVSSALFIFEVVRVFRSRNRELPTRASPVLADDSEANVLFRNIIWFRLGLILVSDIMWCPHAHKHTQRTHTHTTRTERQVFGWTNEIQKASPAFRLTPVNDTPTRRFRHTTSTLDTAHTHTHTHTQTRTHTYRRTVRTTHTQSLTCVSMLHCIVLGCVVGRVSCVVCVP